jgi:hypothetical protein
VSSHRVFAESVAVQMETDSESAVGIIEWIAIILPLLQMLPCFVSMTATQKQQWIADHPNAARNQAIRQLRANSPTKMKRRDARPIADQMIEQAVSMSPEEFEATFGG